MLLNYNFQSASYFTAGLYLCEKVVSCLTYTCNYSQAIILKLFENRPIVISWYFFLRNKNYSYQKKLFSLHLTAIKVFLYTGNYNS